MGTVVEIPDAGDPGDRFAARSYFPNTLGWCAMSAVDRAIVGAVSAVVGLAGDPGTALLT